MSSEIDRIRRDVTLSEIALQFGVQLRRCGDEWIANCPFHDDETPSFSIFAAKDHVQRMHCFGCNARGDVIDFVQRIKGVDFGQAIAILRGSSAGPNVAPVRIEHRDNYACITPLEPTRTISVGRAVELYNPKRAGTDRATGSFTPSVVHPYRRADGSLYGYVLRRDLPDGGKETPMVMWVRLSNGQECWARFPFPKPRSLYGLHNLPSEGQIAIVEGEKCCDEYIKNMKGSAVSWAGGTNGVAHTDWSPLAGRSVVIWPDADSPGTAAAQAIAAVLASMGCRIEILDVGIGAESATKAFRFEDWRSGNRAPKGWDCADAFRDGWTRDNVLTFMRATAKLWAPPEAEQRAAALPAPAVELQPRQRGEREQNLIVPTSSPIENGTESSADTTGMRREIHVVAGKIHQAVDASILVLSNPALGVYSRGGDVVRAVTYRVPEGTLSIAKKAENFSRADGSVVVSPFSEPALVETLTRHAQYFKWNVRMSDFVPCNCPPEVAAMVMARRGYDWLMPPLRAIISAPTLRPDGSVISEPGYDRATGLLLVGDRLWRAVPQQPTQREAIDALDVLTEPMASFPFVDNSDRAAALALMITAVLRPSLRTAPMFAVTAPAAGTGKSLLIDIASILATGRAAAVVSPTPDEIELEKRIGAVALAGDQVVTIDNVAHPLKSVLLCQMLTQVEVQVRVLGASKTVRIPSTGLICCTGNNLSIVGDLNRRVIRIRLDAQCEQPDARLFDFDPCQLAMSRRAELVAAALTIVKSYIAAGAPSQAPPMGSFEDWSDTVRSALIWLGMGDCRGDVDAMRAEDPEKEELAAIIAALPAWQFTARDMVAKANSDPDLREALASLAARGSGGLTSKKFGKYLASQRGVIVGGRKIEQVSNDGTHGAVWKVRNSDAGDW